jgi:MinD-like ATPase involved in chromosome partitioning or flagellar assembly
MGHKRGQIVTFYSYKGGVGRTSALANVAWILASSGCRVLVIDWDLEAPSLHRYFRPFLEDSTGVANPGLIDLLHERSIAAANKYAIVGQIPDPQALDVLAYVQSVNWTFPGSGYLDLMPGGRYDASYGTRVNTFEWDTFYEKLDGAAFFDQLRTHLRGEYDYVLIDSRTGSADSAGICTTRLPDLLVVCFDLNPHTMTTCGRIARSAIEQRPREPIRVFPVPMRVERAEKELLDRSFAEVERIFSPIMSERSPEVLRRYWQEVAFFYTPYYSFGEMLSVFGDAHRPPDSLLASAERLTAHLTNEQITSAPVISPEERRKILEQYKQSS